jgi:hypothetical protein
VEAVEEASGGMLAAPEPPPCEEVLTSTHPDDDPPYDSTWMTDADLWDTDAAPAGVSGVTFQNLSEASVPTEDPDIPTLSGFRIGGYHLFTASNQSSASGGATTITGLPAHAYVRLYGWARTWSSASKGGLSLQVGLNSAPAPETGLDFGTVSNLPSWKQETYDIYDIALVGSSGYSDPDPFEIEGWTDFEGTLVVWAALLHTGRLVNHAASFAFYRLSVLSAEGECENDVPTLPAAPTIDSVVPQVSGTTLTLTAELSDPTDAIAAGAATIHFQTWNGSDYVDVGTYTQTTATGTAASPAADTYTATVTLEEDGTPTEWRVLITYYDATDTEQDGGSVEGSSQAALNTELILDNDGNIVTDNNGEPLYALV